jgi:hypothetical protein
MVKEADFKETSVHVYKNTIYYRFALQILPYSLGGILKVTKLVLKTKMVVSFFTRDYSLFDAPSFRTDCILFYIF